MDRPPLDDRWTAEGPTPDDLDRTSPDGPVRADPPPVAVRIRPRMGISLPAALGAALLVTALAFGANALRTAVEPASAERDTPIAEASSDPSKSDGDDGDQPVEKPGDEPSGDPSDKPTEPDPSAKPDEPAPSDKPEASAEPSKEPAPEPTHKATPEPTAKATPKPTPKPTTAPGSTLELTAVAGDGRVKLAWSAYKGDRFEYYKVVRSTDKTVTWPGGGSDSLIGVIDDAATTWLKDADGVGGKTYWYRVFAVRHGENGYVVLAASPARKVVFPKDAPAPTPKPTPKPTPEPAILSLETDATADGVKLAWEACGSDGFRYYKVVRSASSDPSYLPWTDGTELIAVVEDGSVTRFTDGSVASGDTWFYRVQSIGVVDGVKVVLGETPAVKVTVP